MFGGFCLAPSRLLAQALHGERVDCHAIDLATGEDEIVKRGWAPMALLGDHRHLLAGRRTKNGRHIALVDLPGLEVVWERTPPKTDLDIGFEAEVACGEGRAFVGCGAQLMALDLGTGEPPWEADLVPIGGPHHADWTPMVSGGVVVVSTAKGAAAFDTATGKLRWEVPFGIVRAIYDGRLYALWNTEYIVADLASGKTVTRVDVVSRMKEHLKVSQASRLELMLWPAVSETHVFTGDASGRVWALERETGEPVWHHRPDDSPGFAPAEPVIAGNRLYVTARRPDMRPGGERLYCYEGVE